MLLLAGLLPLAGADAAAGPQADAARVLALPQHPPVDQDLFPSQFLYQNVPLLLSSEGTYTHAKPMSPYVGPQPSASQIRVQLGRFVSAQTGSKALVKQALALYDSSKVAARIPDPKLRAAFAGLTGTTLAPAQAEFMSQSAWFAAKPALGFGQPFKLSAPSTTQRGYDAQKQKEVAQILISSRYQQEPWQLFVALVGHELQHGYGQATPADEAVTNYEAAIEYAELLAKQPQLAYWDTELARRLNGFVMFFLDSRQPGSAQPQIIAPDGLGIFPGSNNKAKDLWSDYTPSGSGVSPAPPEAMTVLHHLLPGVKLPQPLLYNQQTAALFDHLADPALAPVVRLRLAVLLQLVRVKQISATLGMAPAQAIKIFGLPSYLAVVAQGQRQP